MNVCTLVSRLLAKRPLVFWNASDAYLLRTGETGSGGFERIGAGSPAVELEEANTFGLAQLLSYDEMALAAMLGVSVPSHFINDGGRRNAGKAGAAGSFEASGVLVALVGARFERRGLMEWRHLLVTRAQNTAENGYGAQRRRDDPLLSAWAAFYGQPPPPPGEAGRDKKDDDGGGGGGEHYFPSFEEAEADTSGRFLALRADGSVLLNIAAYKHRLRMCVEPFLLDAEARACAAQQRAYLHLVGLGLGCWCLSERQADYMLEVYAEVLRAHTLPHLAVLDFSWFPRHVCALDGVSHGEVK